MTIARSIDPAAAGYVRHRFLRALNASFVVAALFGVIALVVGQMAAAASQGDYSIITAAPISVPVIAIVVVAPLMLLIALIGAVIDVLHRRVLALALLPINLGLCVLLSLSSVSAVAQLAGVDVFSNSVRPQSSVNLAALAAFCLVGAAVFYELTRQNWWQLTARAADFRAARGWRPPVFRLFTTFRRHMGLPAFLANVGRNRLAATLLYLGVAVLNVGLAMLLLLPLMLSSPSERTAEFDPQAMIIGMAALLGLNLVGAGALLSKLADGLATKIYQGVREWDARAPIVFLRAFDQDKERLKARGGDPFARWPAGVGKPRTLDEILLEHASPYGPVIAIGDPRDPTPPLGAARVFVPEHGNGWQDVVKGLVQASKAVVMSPNCGEGVQWELDLIAQAGGRLQVIYLASPELSREDTLALFKRLVPAMPEIAAGQRPVAAFALNGEWRVLTAGRLSVDSYTTALNTALQALFGTAGEALKRPRRGAA